MKTLLLLAMAVLILGGCASLSTMEKVQNRLGPPAKVEQLGNGYTTHYYYKACNRYDCLCNEFTYGQNGKVIKTRRYWTQGVLDVIKGEQEK
jgi:hypothetical protein